ncbi:hypothetical protein HK097_002357 [Rhizophlyctis rosea]|uniref:Uncharacterized protein n=1 Tax=Rhizophlyctis rosea TaxID=64517 RepID=A0AAD5SFJ9_9FUNG|nr:hypothetical protein HK097_002357 [Rhizophlyctis rosea]
MFSPPLYPSVSASALFPNPTRPSSSRSSSLISLASLPLDLSGTRLSLIEAPKLPHGAALPKSFSRPGLHNTSTIVHAQRKGSKGNLCPKTKSHTALAAETIARGNGEPAKPNKPAKTDKKPRSKPSSTSSPTTKLASQPPSTTSSQTTYKPLRRSKSAVVANKTKRSNSSSHLRAEFVGILSSGKRDEEKSGEDSNKEESERDGKTGKGRRRGVSVGPLTSSKKQLSSKIWIQDTILPNRETPAQTMHRILASKSQQLKQRDQARKERKQRYAEIACLNHIFRVVEEEMWKVRKAELDARVSCEEGIRGGSGVGRVDGV